MKYHTVTKGRFNLILYGKLYIIKLLLGWKFLAKRGAPITPGDLHGSRDYRAPTLKKKKKRISIRGGLQIQTPIYYNPDYGGYERSSQFWKATFRRKMPRSLNSEKPILSHREPEARATGLGFRIWGFGVRAIC